MSVIQNITAREILDSRGEPTTEVTLRLAEAVGVASVPAGASTGSHEAHELRDDDSNRYDGKGVLSACSNVANEISQSIVGKEWSQEELDRHLIELDGTADKSRLGANAILGVSMAFAKANAIEQGIELYEHLGTLAGNTAYAIPQPMFNIINGGKHADSGLDIQEFLLAPTNFSTLREKVRAGSEIIHSLKQLLAESGYAVSVGDEGGFAPKFESNEEAFDFITKAIEKAGYSTQQVQIGIDAAASSFYKDGTYNLRIGMGARSLSSEELIQWYESLTSKYPLISIEDGCAEDDWEGFQMLRQKLGDSYTIVGDDLTVTNVERIAMASDKKAINSVLIKLNQIGTVTETIDAIKATHAQGWKAFVSHRSGETTDTFIADLAVGLSCELFKSGSLVRGERVCKYNRLMEIENKLLGL